MAGSGRASGDQGSRRLRRVALSAFLLGFLLLFGLFAIRLVPTLPLLTEADISDVPAHKLFTRSEFLIHTAGVAVERASREPGFLSRMRILLKAEVAARKAVALRPVGSEAWHHRAYVALKSGRTEDAGRYVRIALHDGPFSSRFSPSRLGLGLRFWGSLSESEKRRHYALIRKVVYHEPEFLVRGLVPTEVLVSHLRAAVGDDKRLVGNIDRRLRKLGLQPDGSRR